MPKKREWFRARTGCAFCLVLAMLAAAPALAATWRFAVVGDTHVSADSSSLPAEIVAALLQEDVRLVLFPGDIAEGGSGSTEGRLLRQLETWQAITAPLVAAGVEVFPVRGNHEADVPQGASAWTEAFSGAWALPADGPEGERGFTYSLVRENALFVACDNYADLHRVNQDWLDTVLDAHRDVPLRFVFGHEPAFRVFHTDCLGTEAPARNDFWASLRSHGVRAYFCGHDHFFDAARVDDGDGDPSDDVWQCLVGAGGGPLFDTYFYGGDNAPYAPVGWDHRGEYGYLLVEVSGSEPGPPHVLCTWKRRMTDDGGACRYEAAGIPFALPEAARDRRGAYRAVDTCVSACFDETKEIPSPGSGEPFFGQDAQHAGNLPSYTDNGDGTVSDNVTGLLWVKARGAKVSWEAARAGADSCTAGGYTDWRMPTVKELYSLIRFSGSCGTSMTSTAGYIPFLDTSVFDFTYGAGTGTERVIDCQDWTATRYVSTTMKGNETAFGVNFADGRIKGYPVVKTDATGQSDNLLYVRYVRGNPDYGRNQFVSNGDGTVTDEAAGLMWACSDSGTGMDWRAALAWVQEKNAQRFLGYGDWRLPDAKELHTLVDYARSPDTTASPALDSALLCTPIVNEGGQVDYPYFWTSTSFRDGSQGTVPAAYIAFGRASGYMQSPPGSGTYLLEDVHGAGAQRSDPKSGSESDYPHGRGPQGDVVRIANFVRLVRSFSLETVAGDLDGDGDLTPADAERLSRHLAGSFRLPAWSLERADLDGDGAVGVGDLVRLRRLAAAFVDTHLSSGETGGFRTRP